MYAGRCTVATAVTRCEPEVEGRKQLEAALLGGGVRNFSGFVRAMRARFVAAATGSSL